MKRFFFLMIVVLLVGCNQEEEVQDNETEKVAETDDTVEIDNPSGENTIPVEQQVLDRLNSFLLLAQIGDVKPNLTTDGDYFVLLNLVRSFPEEAPIISQSEIFHGYYDNYKMNDLQELLLKYHGFTIDFKKYATSKFEEDEKIIVQGDEVFLLSSEESTIIGNQTPIIKSLEQMEEGVYSVHFQYYAFSMKEYEEATGKEWDPAYSQFPIDKWPEEFQPYVQEYPIHYFAIFIENEYGLALTYLSQKVLEHNVEDEVLEGTNIFDEVEEVDELEELK